MSGLTVNEVRERFVETAGNTTQSLGAGRVIGQIFAHLYFSRHPQSLDNLCEQLGISKGSASMAVRQLEHWGAVRRVWIKGDRKAYYEALDEFGKIVRRAAFEAISQRIETADTLTADIEAILDQRKKEHDRLDEDWAFIEQRLQRFKKFRDRGQWLWDKFIVGLLSQ
jgi:DNA-binding transcriptional regulator GbsR (MarR family)